MLNKHGTGPCGLRVNKFTCNSNIFPGGKFVRLFQIGSEFIWFNISRDISSQE